MDPVVMSRFGALAETLLASGNEVMTVTYEDPLSASIIYTGSETGEMIAAADLIVAGWDWSAAADEVYKSEQARKQKQLLAEQVGPLDIPTAVTLHRTPVSNTYTIRPDDYLIGVISTASPYQLVLPSASELPGRSYLVKDESGAAALHPIQLVTSLGQTIDGTSTRTIDMNYGSLTVYSDGQNWFTI